VLIRLIALIVLTMLTACSGSDDPAVQRAAHARQAMNENANGQIVIGAAAPWSLQLNLLSEGIEMATEEVNEGGGVLGKKLTVIRKDDGNSRDKGQLVAQEFADDPDVAVVIGHSQSFISEPASIIYQYHGLLMISPLSSSTRLTERGFSRVLRTIPDDGQMGEALARYCRDHRLRQVIIYNVLNAYGEDLANAFELEASQYGIVVLDRSSYDAYTKPAQHREVLSHWQDNFTFDAIILAGNLPQGAEFVREAGSLGLQVPIVAGEALDNPALVKIAGPAADRVLTVSTFHPQGPAVELQKFIRAFQQRIADYP